MKHLLPILLLLLLIGCPKPDDDIICGQGMMLDADTCACIPNSHPADDGESCECDSLYHWNDDMTVCVLDTSSHDFIWVVDTLGLYGGIVRDVVIISENDIRIVGEMWLPDPDSSYNGSGREMFNSAKWDGQEWEYIAIETEFFGNTIRPRLHSILYFVDDDVWVTDSGYPLHWDGLKWTIYQFYLMGLVNSAGLDMWGNASDNIFFVGGNGGIVHYDGSTFTRMISDTEIDLYGVSGSNDGEHVFACGWRDNSPLGSIALELVEGGWETIYSAVSSMPNNNYGWVESVDVFGGVAYFSTLAGLWEYNYVDATSTLIPNTDPKYSFLFRDTDNLICNNPNDLFLIGRDFTIIHFNGSTWNFDDQFLAKYGVSNVYAKGVDYKNDMLVIGGYFDGGKPIVARGYRN